MTRDLLSRGNIIQCVFVRFVHVVSIDALVSIKELIYHSEEKRLITVIINLVQELSIKLKDLARIIIMKDTTTLHY